MAEESVENMVYLAITTVIAIFLVSLIVILWNSLAEVTYENITFANVEKLKSAMEEACLRGADKTTPVIIEDLEMPQRLPGYTNIAVVRDFVETFIGKFYIYQTGDPAFVLYYEMFPPGEGMSWELYFNDEDIGNRVLAIIGDEDPEKFISDNKKLAEGYVDNDLPVNAIISNVKLTDYFDLYKGKEVERPSDFFGFGEWESYKGGDEKFEFKNYIGLSYLNKTLVKHMSCGNDVLCLKTTKAVYTYELKYCDDIDYIQLYDSSLGRYEPRTDFYLASPCTMKKVKVYIDDECKCENSIVFDMYDYTDSGLEPIGKHTICLDRVYGGDAGESGKMKCLVVEWDRDAEDGCYSYQESALAMLIGARHYVEDTTRYIAPNMFIIDISDAEMPSPIGETVLIEENPAWP